METSEEHRGGDVFGGTELDWRKAICRPEAASSGSSAFTEDARSYVPEGVRVEVRGMGVFGGFSKSVDEEGGDESMPLVPCGHSRLRGLRGEGAEAEG
jgi:hypothetical protein